MHICVDELIALWNAVVNVVLPCWYCAWGYVRAALTVGGALLRRP